MAATDGTGAGRSDDNPTESGDSHASPPTVPPNNVTTAMPEQPPDMPEHLGRYLFKRKLGGGGMGAVYLVENTDLMREEALKVPRFKSVSDMGERERFLREARVAAQLDHPNLCAIHDVGVIDGTYFLTMRYLKGKPLSEYTRRPQSPGDAVKIVVKLAQALEYAHGMGVIHRDLKPSNIMMCQGSGPTVMDFGLAKQTHVQDKRLTQSGMMIGTPAYMPLEQLKGELNLIAPASDVYSLGVILFELLTARLPFEGSMAEIIGKVQFTEAPPPSRFGREVNRALDAVCCKALAKTLAERYPSMKAFAAALIEAQRTRAPNERVMPSPSSTEFINDAGMKMLSIPGNTFTMGSPEGEADRGDDENQDRVTISSFHLGMQEVTQKQFRAVMGYNPSYFSKDATGKKGIDYGDWKPSGGADRIPQEEDTEDYPVENVSWEEAKEFCEKLTAKDTKKLSGQVYRLPTEAEWEYACRGGAPYQVFHFGNSLSGKQANFDSHVPYGGADKVTPLNRTCKVGSYEKNRFGLYDMHGNVLEWCQDWYNSDYYWKSPAKDPLGPAGASNRVIRGGCWDGDGEYCRSARRSRFRPGYRINFLGLRVAVVPSERK